MRGNREEIETLDHANGMPFIIGNDLRLYLIQPQPTANKSGHGQQPVPTQPSTIAHPSFAMPFRSRREERRVLLQFLLCDRYISDLWLDS